MRRVLVPLPRDEALWIAVTIARGMRVSGHAGQRPLCVSVIAQSEDGSALISVDAVCAASGPRPLDSVTFILADRTTALKRHHLTVEIKSNTGHSVGQLSVVLATLPLYAQMSGLPPPLPTSDQDAYGGWRLP
jgi:hypothetical protein